jgi:hypothetical protein
MISRSALFLSALVLARTGCDASAGAPDWTAPPLCPDEQGGYAAASEDIAIVADDRPAVDGGAGGAGGAW